METARNGARATHWPVSRDCSERFYSFVTSLFFNSTPRANTSEDPALAITNQRIMSPGKRTSPVGANAGSRSCDWADKPMDPRSVASRQRGKIYRAKQKQYQRQLRKSVGDLRQQLHNLSIQSALQQRLAAYSVVIRQAVMSRLEDAFEGMSTLTTSKRVGHVRFHIDSFQVQGSLEAPVIVLIGSLCGQLSHSTVHQLYHCTPGNTALLHALIGREVKCLTTHTLFFAVDGSLDHELTETDFFTQLASLAPSFSGLGEMLRELPCIVRSGDPPTAFRGVNNSAKREGGGLAQRT